MSFLNAFIVSFGGMLAASAIVVAWLFRTSSAPLAAKIAIPTILVALACWSPTTVNSLLGLPLTASFDQLPERAELVAFVAHDDAGLADLWLRVDASASTSSEQDIPRAYETPLTARMKKTLRDAQQEMAKGERVILAKHGSQSKKPGEHPVAALSTTDNTNGYTIDVKAFPLPQKDE